MRKLKPRPCHWCRTVFTPYRRPDEKFCRRGAREDGRSCKDQYWDAVAELGQQAVDRRLAARRRAPRKPPAWAVLADEAKDLTGAPSRARVLQEAMERYLCDLALDELERQADSSRPRLEAVG